MQKGRKGIDRKRKGVLKHKREKVLKKQLAENKRKLQQKFSPAQLYF